MLILDGADCVGKTTLQRAILEQINLQGIPSMGFHLSRPPVGFDIGLQYVMYASHLSVWDRFHISQLAYRELDEHPFDATPFQWETLDATLRSRFGAFNVIVVADNAIVSNRFNRAGKEEMYPLDHVLQVNSRFQQLADNGRIDVRGQTFSCRIDLVVDTSTGLVDDLAEIIATEYLRFYDEYVRIRERMPDSGS